MRSSRAAPVDIVVSTGPETVEVPDVSSDCLSYGGANSLIKAAGLVADKGDPVAIEPICSNPNRIVGQDPDAGHDGRGRLDGHGVPR